MRLFTHFPLIFPISTHFPHHPFFNLILAYNIAFPHFPPFHRFPRFPSPLPPHLPCFPCFSTLQW